MIEQIYALTPFPDTGIPAIEITAHVHRENGLLHIQYALSGETEKIHLPENAGAPGRRDSLWSSTCFEFFLALPGDPRYWEFNLSPSGDWNIYQMDAYRRVGFREEMSLGRLQVAAKRNARSIRLDAAVDLSPLIARAQRLELGIASVIQGLDQHKTYWAVAHPHPEPDFHVRDSFIIQL